MLYTELTQRHKLDSGEFNIMLALKQITDRLNFVNRHNRPGPIGLAFAIEKVYLVQLEQKLDGEIVLRASAAVEYPTNREELLASSKAVKSLLKLALKLAPFSGRNIVTTLLPGDIRMMSIAYQLDKGKSETDAIVKLLESRIKGDLIDYVVDYLPIRAHTSDDERLALVALAKRDIVFEYLELLRMAGFMVEALDIAPSAIKRLISAVSDVDRTDNILVINFGGIKSYMTLISGQRLLFDQGIDFGEVHLIERIASSLDISQEQARELVYTHGLSPSNPEQEDNYQLPDEEVSETLVEIVKPKFLKLVDEINRVLIYAASETRGKPVKHVYLLGSIARWNGADKVLNKLINIPVSLPNFISKFGHASDYGNYEDSLPEMAVATGLALRGMKVIV